jgi:hypothetical protein
VRSTRITLGVVVLALLGLAVSLTALWLHSPEPVSTGPGAEPSARVGRDAQQPPATGADAGRDRPVGRVDASLGAVERQAPQRPVRVSVPTAAIDLPVRPVGVARDGQMQLPPRPTVLGWYRYGPAPGDREGSVMVAGHLDSRRFGLGPLVGLRQVEVGDAVRVLRVDGTVLRYRVVGVARYDRQALPPELFSRTGRERLRLVTCGGAYDARRGGYQQNLVVTAEPV